VISIGHVTFSNLRERQTHDPPNVDYWRYPVETLVGNGDCEDKAVLFASIMKAAGYDVALILFEDHAMAGVALPGEPVYGTQEYFHWYAIGFGEARKGERYPKLVKSTGKSPPQY